jgi:hypothetical protein
MMSVKHPFGLMSNEYLINIAESGFQWYIQWYMEILLISKVIFRLSFFKPFRIHHVIICSPGNKKFKVFF